MDTDSHEGDAPDRDDKTQLGPEHVRVAQPSLL